MRGINKVIIVGTLGTDPDVKQFPNGGSVTRISVATSDQWTDKQTGERREATEWHRISLFNRLGEIAAQYLRKGSQVYIEGSLRTNKYTDQNGIERYATEIRADNMQMLGGNAGAQPSAMQQSPMGQPNVYGGQTPHSQPIYNTPAPQSNNSMPQQGWPAPSQATPAAQPQNFNAANPYMNNPTANPAANPTASTAAANVTPKPGAMDDDIPF